MLESVSVVLFVFLHSSALLFCALGILIHFFFILLVFFFFIVAVILFAIAVVACCLFVREHRTIQALRLVGFVCVCVHFVLVFGMVKG